MMTPECDDMTYDTKYKIGDSVCIKPNQWPTMIVKSSQVYYSSEDGFKEIVTVVWIAADGNVKTYDFDSRMIEKKA